MNLLLFLKSVDEITEKMSKESLVKFIHEYSRTIDENERENYVKILNQFILNIDKKLKTSDADEQKIQKIKDSVLNMKNKIYKLSDNSRYYDSEFNEDYDDWYDDYGDDIRLIDNFGINADLRKAVNLVHQCIDNELYKEGYALAKAISEVEIQVEGEYTDIYGESSINARDFKTFEIIPDCQEFFGEALFLSYISNDLNERPKEIMSIFSHIESGKEIRKIIIDKSNNCLPEFNEFLPLWTRYLCNYTNSLFSKNLIKEAYLMIEDKSTLINLANECYQNVPELYLYLLKAELDSNDTENMLSIGINAVKKLSYKCSCRSEIALLAAEYANKLNDQDTKEELWLEAFKSEITIKNYIRIKFQIRDYDKIKNEVISIYQNIKEEKNDYYIMMFFDEKFEEVAKSTISRNCSLNCEIISLFLILFYNDYEIKTGINKSLNYLSYILPNDLSIQEFWNLLFNWKKEITIDEDLKNNIIGNIKEIISNYTSKILKNQDRASYSTCANLIAAVDDVVNENLKLEYKNKYPRHRCFVQCLKDLGLK